MGTVLKVAVTVRGAVMLTVHVLPMPLQSPPQVEKEWAESAVAVRTTVLSVSKPKAQTLVPMTSGLVQLVMPEGALVTEPPGETATVSTGCESETTAALPDVTAAGTSSKPVAVYVWVPLMRSVAKLISALVGGEMTYGPKIAAVGRPISLVQVIWDILAVPQSAFSTAWLFGRIADSVTSQAAIVGPAAVSPKASESKNANLVFTPKILVFMSQVLSALGGHKIERTAERSIRFACLL